MITKDRVKWAIVYRGTRYGYNPQVDVWYWTGAYWSSNAKSAKQYKRAPYSLPHPRQGGAGRILLDTEYGQPEFGNARWYGSDGLVARMEVI